MYDIPKHDSSTDLSLWSNQIMPKDVATEIEKINSNSTEGEADCIICMDGQVDTVIVSCGHQVLCNNCATTLEIKECPVCRKAVGENGIIKVYKC